MKCKYLVLMIFVLSCNNHGDNKTKDMDSLKLGNDVVYFEPTPVSDTIFFNDRNSVVYIHDTVYRTKVKYDTILVWGNSGGIGIDAYVFDSARTIIYDTSLMFDTSLGHIIINNQ